MQSDDGSSLPSVNRVCDNCIRKKVKCDLVRPVCSHCSLRGLACHYSSTRRRPGPVRGSRRGSRVSRRGQSALGRERFSADPEDEPPHIAEPSPGNSAWTTEAIASSSPRPSAVDVETTPTHASIVSHEPTASVHSGSSQEARAPRSEGIEQLARLGILPDEADHLLQQFLDIVHGSIPIFSKARFVSGFRNSLYNRDLVLALVLITAKLTGFTFASRGFDLDGRIDVMLSSESLEQDMCEEPLSLDQFRKACLLAFYEFHQFPGQQAWMRVGRLARLAYWGGLDRLDGPRNLHTQGHSLFGWGNASQDDIDDWRLVWWFIYCLDSYVNLSSGTPYLIDERKVKTGLLSSTPQHADGQGEGRPGAPKPELYYLPPHPTDLWRLVAAITSGSPGTVLPNLHIVSATATRQVGRALQLHMLTMPSTETDTASLTEAEACVSALRLALPCNYLNPTRNAFRDETCPDHHARLVTVLHLLQCRLLLSILRCAALDQGDDGWLLNWQKVFEACQDIASIAEQWNGTFSRSVDPAMCFIIFTALIFLDFHAKFAGVDSALRPKIEHCEVVLVLLLEQFASTWTLPRLLILSFKGFKASTTGPLDRRYMQSILVRFEAPLHPRWLKFLSSAQPDPETQLPEAV